MTHHTAYNQIIQQLTQRYGAGEATSIARIVLEDVFHWHPQQADREMDATENERFEGILNRLMTGEPLQYVLGLADFFGLKYTVSPAVLIPRQETEELVAWILEYLKTDPAPHPTVMDIGLGSGCIGLTLKKKHPAIQLFGLEKSPEALAVARHNAARLLGETPAGLYLQEGDILMPLLLPQYPPLSLVVSNPPYIPLTEKHLVPQHVEAFEPQLALFVPNEQPLLFYEAIADFSAEKLRPGGALFFECNEFNATDVATMLTEKGFEHLQLRQDLSGADRMILVRKRGS